VERDFMIICTKCGVNVAVGKRFCTECGNPVDNPKPPEQEPLEQKPPEQKPHEQEPPVQENPPTQAVHTEAAPTTVQPTAHIQQPTPVQQVPHIQQAPPPTFANEQPPLYGSPYAVMSVGGFVGAGLIMAIPVIGWLICVIWACGGCRNHNRRNYARAYLIFLVIFAVISFLLYLTISWLANTLLDTFIEILRNRI